MSNSEINSARNVRKPKKNHPVTFVHGTDKDMEALTDRYTL